MLAKVARISAMEYSRLVQYRLDVLLWTLAQASTPVVAMAVWYAVATTSSSGTPPKDVFTYYVLALIIFIITFSWNGAHLAREILEGEIVKYVVRPLSIFIKHGVNNIVVKLFRLLIPVPLLLTGVIWFRGYFSAEIYELSNILLFLPSLLMAAVLAFTFDMAFGTIAFWVEDAFEIRRYKEMAHEITSGLLIPFTMLPEAVRAVFNLLPFRFMIAVPIDILMGTPSHAQTLTLLTQQAAWTIASVALVTILWKQGLKRYAVPGQ